jgi:multiple sugar transport system substrate-binding protein
MKKYSFYSLGRTLRLVLLVTAVCAAAAGCRRTGEGEAGTTLVFKHGKIEGDPRAFQEILDTFEKRNPGIRIVDEMLPSSTGEQHQFYIINLEGRSADFDVFSLDVIWVPEFARAGWIRDLSGILPEKERGAFFPAAMQAVTMDGKVYAIPWYIDAGVLYYRKDLLAKYGFEPPRTWYDLVRIAQYITKREPELYGFLWQGKQDESLVCNTLEYVWSNGGDLFDGELPALDTPANAEALGFMRDLITKYKVTPPLVTTAGEEVTRQIFGNGRAVFMRNWPYAYEVLRREGSPVRKKTAAAPLPAFPGHESASTLGGWQLGVNRYSRHPEAAEKFVKYLTSEESQRKLSVAVGYKPSRQGLYTEQCLLEAQPFTCALYDVFKKARPRPVTPYYLMITQVMQPEFSAAVSGIRSPEQALKSAEKQIRHIVKVGHEKE